RHAAWRGTWHREADDGPTANAAWSAPRATRSRAVGREVYHESFGRGVVVEADGEGADARYTVRFGTTLKRVLGRFLSGGDHGDPAWGRGAHRRAGAARDPARGPRTRACRAVFGPRVRGDAVQARPGRPVADDVRSRRGRVAPGRTERTPPRS